MQSLPAVGFVGLGKMGAGLARRYIDIGGVSHGFNRTYAVTEEVAKDGLVPAQSLAELVSNLPAEGVKVIWLMLPAGQAVDDALFGPGGLTELLKAGDIIIDGGNSNYKDTQRRAAKLHEHNLRFIDCGTSGGPRGARNGACLMVGGDADAFAEIESVFTKLCKPGACQFFAGSGAGHFVKMVHNGIEYGMMQAIAEGFAIMKASDYHLDLPRVTDIYNNGSVIESRLVGWLQDAYKQYGADLTGVSGSVAHTGEGAWTVEAGKEMGIAAPIIEGSLQFRIDSTNNPSYTGQVVSALRGQFGGHSVADAK